MCVTTNQAPEGDTEAIAGNRSEDHSEARPLDPHMELAIISVVRKMSLSGLQQQQPWHGPLTREMVAAIVSWGLYGAAKEWTLIPERSPSELVADAVVASLLPLVHLGETAATTGTNPL